MKSTAYTDIGTKKKINQDSIYLGEAASNLGDVVFAAICDGMGGLSNGEMASRMIVNGLDTWFREELPDILEKGISSRGINVSLSSFIERMNDEICERSAAMCGSTLTGLLLYNGVYRSVNIGDSRIYQFRDGKYKQLTKDQTVVQRAVDRGEITEEEAKTRRDRNVLLQCVGAGQDIVPVYGAGRYREGDVFMLCSDGLRHKLSKKQMVDIFSPENAGDEEEMKIACKRAVDIVKRRKETDNISVVMIAV